MVYLVLKPGSQHLGLCIHHESDINVSLVSSLSLISKNLSALLLCILS